MELEVDGRDWDGDKEDEPASSTRWGVVPKIEPSLRVERMRRSRSSGANALYVEGSTEVDMLHKTG